MTSEYCDQCVCVCTWCVQGWVNVVKMLLDFGANTELSTNRGETALMKVSIGCFRRTICLNPFSPTLPDFGNNVSTKVLRAILV